ncbi:MAG: hemolysin family protein [Candidatus Margulisiibacteriota bacterium]
MFTIFSLFILVCFSAFFSFSETALTAVNRVKVRKMFEDKLLGSKALYTLRENPSKMLATLLVGNNIVNLAAASIATVIFIDFFAKRSILNEGVTVAVSTLVMTLVILVFGEIIPKTAAIKHADRLSLIVAPIVLALSAIITPVLIFLDWICRPALKLLGADVKSNIPFVTEDELKMILSVGEEEGVIETSENRMIHSIFEFSDTVAKEVMVPRPDMFCMDAGTNVNEALENIFEDGHSRIPVYDGSPENIVGIVMTKDLIKICGGESASVLKDIMRAPLFVPETKKLDELMRLMQTSRSHIAIVVDEYGVVAGLVTLEDLLEEIVGEIEDEFDKEDKGVETLPDGSILVDASLSVSDVNEKVGTRIPEGDYDTIGGFVLSLIGRLPFVGDGTKYEDITITVEKIAKRRITRVRISR